MHVVHVQHLDLVALAQTVVLFADDGRLALYLGCLAVQEVRVRDDLRSSGDVDGEVMVNVGVL